MTAYLLFVVLLIGDEFQIASYSTFEECDQAAVEILKKDKDIFSVRCTLDESK